jgi:2-polyprenyl-3-methyl-5-hydroxy-6-metoxy-1,4-benzoquinol methylase
MGASASGGIKRDPGTYDERHYSSLQSQYADSRSLQSRKLDLVFSLLDHEARLLDIGSGQGAWIDRALSKFDGITGVEVSEAATKRLRERFHEDSRVRILHSKGQEVLFSLAKEPAFDVITLLDVLEHVEEPSKLLLLAHRLLRPGGTILTTTPNWYDKILISIEQNPFHVHAHSSFGWAGLIKSAGFRIRTIRTVDFPIVHSDFLAHHLHVLGMCVVVVGQKPAISS